MQKKMFWACFILLSVVADFSLSLIWGVLAIPVIAFVSWWVAYRSGWFE